MSVVALASVKGAPGATMAAQALALCWRAPVALVDADPAGGDVLWRSRGLRGEPLDPDRGLLSLSAAARRDAGETSLAEHLQPTSEGTDVLVGLSSQEQLTGVAGLWSQLPALMSSHPTDVIVDCGRLTAGSPVLPVALRADVLVVVVRPDIEGVAHLRSRLSQLQAMQRGRADELVRVHVVVATSYRDTSSAVHLQQLLDAENLTASVAGVLAHDPKAAAVLSSTRIGNPARSLLVRSAAEIAKKLPLSEPVETVVS